MKEFRVVWNREGLSEVSKIYQTKRAAEQLALRLGPEPWLAYDRSPDDTYHEGCDGTDPFDGGACPCKLETVRERSQRQQDKLDPIEYIRVDVRKVGKWEEHRNDD